MWTLGPRFCKGSRRNQDDSVDPAPAYGVADPLYDG